MRHPPDAVREEVRETKRALTPVQTDGRDAVLVFREQKRIVDDVIDHGLGGVGVRRCNGEQGRWNVHAHDVLNVVAGHGGNGAN